MKRERMGDAGVLMIFTGVFWFLLSTYYAEQAATVRDGLANTGHQWAEILGYNYTGSDPTGSGDHLLLWRIQQFVSGALVVVGGFLVWWESRTPRSHDDSGVRDVYEASMESRLFELERLRTNQLISDEEYRQMRASILDSL